jgi:hypothetical protein
LEGHRFAESNGQSRVSNNKLLCWVVQRKELQICCRTHVNIEIKGSHACVVTSGVSDHLPISDDRLHNIFVNAFARVPANSIIDARRNCRECTIALRRGRRLDLHDFTSEISNQPSGIFFLGRKKITLFTSIIVIIRNEKNLIS